LLGASLLAEAAPKPARAIAHGPRDKPRVALTFDACSGRPPWKLDEAVIEALEKNKTKATFFVGGRWAEQDPERVKRLLANPGFEIESHAYDHPHLTGLGSDAIRSEISKANDVLTPLLGHPPRYLRAPYGESNARVVRVAQSLGLTVIKFDLASGDPDRKFSRRRLTRWVLREIRPGSIVVFHVNGRGWHTAEALPGIVAGLEKKGLEPVTLSELLSHDGD
jgi:peptidoglycan/xylan/chitin deacetylase (PgdA/CDA1 family)